MYEVVVNLSHTKWKNHQVRHINFHSFHTKIKCHGLNMLTSHGLQPCLLDPAQRNIVPDLSEAFQVVMVMVTTMMMMIVVVVVVMMMDGTSYPTSASCCSATGSVVNLVPTWTGSCPTSSTHMWLGTPRRCLAIL